MRASSDPSRDWDAYQDARERAYAERIEGRTCFDCANCKQPDGDCKGKLGWCLMADDFVYPWNNPSDAECGAFE